MNEVIVTLDLETTGLDAVNCQILEVGIIVADLNFNEIGRMQYLLDDSNIRWDYLDKTVTAMHNRSHTSEGYPALIGSIARARQDGTLVTPEQCANRMIGWLQAIGVKGQDIYLTGSTIGFDRKFLSIHMPDLENFFHYRSIDVSSLQGFVELRWPSKVLENKPADRKIHRAIPDCEDTLVKYQWLTNTLTNGVGMYAKDYE